MSDKAIPTGASEFGPELFASIGIFGTDLDFEEISRTLRASPTHTHRVGELNLLKKPYPSDLWLLETPLARTEKMDAHLQWLRQTLSAHYGFLRALKDTAQVRSYCGFTADEHGSFRVSGESLRLFTELNIDMELGLVFLGPPDSSEISEAHEPVDANSSAYERGSGTYRTESDLALRITASSLDLSGISSRLGFEPSEAHRTGDVDTSGKVYPTDLWSLSVPLSKTDELDDHFKWLGMALLPHSEFLRSAKRNVDLLVRCNFGTESDTGGVSISPEGLSVCTELDISLEFNAYLI